MRRSLDARLRKLEEQTAATDDPLTVIIRTWADGEAGIFSLDNVDIPRRPGESEDAYKARAIALAPVGNGIRVINLRESW